MGTPNSSRAPKCIFSNRTVTFVVKCSNGEVIDFNFLNQAQPALGFLKLFDKKYVSAFTCLYVCMYICLSFCTHESKPFTWTLKAVFLQTLKAKQSLHYTHAQVSSPSKECSFPNRKPYIATILRLQSQLS